MKPINSTIRAITFDAGGTLVYPHPSVGEIYRSVLLLYGVDIASETLEISFNDVLQRAERLTPSAVSDDSYRGWWKNLVREMLNNLSVSVDHFDAFFEELWWVFAKPEHWKLFPEARETLSELNNSEISVAILSNWDNRLRHLIDGLGIAAHFDEIVISSEVGFEKPDRQIFQLTQERLGIPPSEILHIGDSLYHDRDGALNAGWQCLVIDRNRVTTKRDDSVIRSLAQIVELLR